MIQLLLARPFLIYAAVAAVAFVGGSAFHKLFSDRKIAALEQRYSEQRLEWQEKIAQGEARARLREAELQDAVDVERGRLDESLQKINEQARSITRLRVDRDQLHNDLVAYAAASPAADTIAACRARAERLAVAVADGAELLDEGRELAATAAEAADRRGAKLTACLSAWPK
jgi:hypothetical protein